MKNIIKTLTAVIISLVSSCAGILGNNVKLTSYPEINKNNNKIINLSVDTELNNKRFNFNKNIFSEFEKNGISSGKVSNKVGHGCFVNFYTQRDDKTKMTLG